MKVLSCISAATTFISMPLSTHDSFTGLSFCAIFGETEYIISYAVPFPVAAKAGTAQQKHRHIQAAMVIHQRAGLNR